MRSRRTKRLWDQRDLRFQLSMKDGSGVNKSVVNHLVNGRGGKGGGIMKSV